MVANDDLEGKTTHFTGFYTHTIFEPKIPKPPIVNHKHRAKLLRVGVILYNPVYTFDY